MKDNVVLAGGSGLIGGALARVLVEKGYEVSVLTRSPSHRRGAIEHVHWDGRTLGPWTNLLDGAKAVVNLAGRTVNCRHTPENRREIIDSRLDSVRTLGRAITDCTAPPDSFVQASGIAIYGDTGDREAEESEPPSNGFLADICKMWENAFHQIAVGGMRRSVLRIAPVLARDAGFLKPLGLLTRWFLGGQMGSGRQFISWVHVADLCRMFVWAIERSDISGTYNAVSSNPVRNAEFMCELRRVLHRPWSPPVPKWTVPLGSWLLQTEGRLALTSCRAIPSRFIASGFRFQFPEIRGALANVYPSR